MVRKCKYCHYPVLQPSLENNERKRSKVNIIKYLLKKCNDTVKKSQWLNWWQYRLHIVMLIGTLFWWYKPSNWYVSPYIIGWMQFCKSAGCWTYNGCIGVVLPAAQPSLQTHGWACPAPGSWQTKEEENCRKWGIRGGGIRGWWECSWRWSGYSVYFILHS